MKKDKKNNTSEYLNRTLEEAKYLEDTMQNSLDESMKAILAEAVSREMHNVLLEADDDNYYEEEDDGNTEDMPTSDIDNNDTATDVNADNSDTESDETSFEQDDFSDDDEDKWAEFNDYKDENGAYNFADADKDTMTRVFKLLKGDEDIKVTDNNGLITIDDQTTGNQYVVDTNGQLGGDNAADAEEDIPNDADAVAVPADTDVDLDADSDATATDDADLDLDADATDYMDADLSADDTEEVDDEDNKTDESIFEVTLNDEEEEQVNEDGNLGYTTNYQKKTAMTTPDNHEPAKASQSYSMDNGVPTGTDKPYGKNKGDNQPFDKNVTEGCDECDENACPTDGDEEQVEEGTNVGGFVQQNSTSKSHVPNSNGRKARNMSKGGEHTATSTPRYSEAQMESIKAKAKEIFNENKKIRMVLENVKSKLQQAALVNKNLGMILKLVTENSTTQEEKHNIIRRFNDEATDINKSEQLYESISKELKNVNRSSNVSNVMNGSALTENVNKKQINETKVYQSQDLLKSLNLMNRMSKY